MSNNTIVHIYQKIGAFNEINSDPKSIDFNWVASMEFEEFLSHSKMVALAFEETNTKDISPWVKSDKLTINPEYKDGCRSTMINDVISIIEPDSTATNYVVSAEGFDLIEF